MKRSKNFILLFILLSFIFIISVPVFNYTTDRYRVFNALRGDFGEYYWRSDSKWEYSHNDRFIPMAYLISEKHKYDSLIFGDSRSYAMNSQHFGEYWYKLGYNGGRQFEHLHNLKSLIKNNIKVKNIVLLVSLDQFEYFKPKFRYKTILYPQNFYEWSMFYYKYLFKRIESKDSKMFFLSSYSLNKVSVYHIKDEVPSKSRELYANDIKIKKMTTRSSWRFNKKTSRDVLNRIRNIKELSDSNNIKFTLILIPSHYKRLLHYDLNDIKSLKKELFNITNFYDFTLPHDYIINNKYWKEPIHYSSLISDDMIRLIKREKQWNGPFGRLITKKNINDILNQSNLSRIEIDTLEKYDINLKIHKSYYENIENSSKTRNLFKGINTKESNLID